MLHKTEDEKTASNDNYLTTILHLQVRKEPTKTVFRRRIYGKEYFNVTHAINDYNWTPVRTLLEGNLPKDSVEYTQLQQITVYGNIIKEVCTRGFTELVNVFLNSGFPVNCIICKSTGRTMLHLAAGTGHLFLVKMLLNAGADIDCKTSNGETPLFSAVQKHQLEVVRHLISVGADINTCDKRGKTLLDATYHYNTVKEEMLQLLLDSGCDPNKSFSYCRLYWEVRSNNIKYVKMLLDAGANVNGTVRGIPLHEAARFGFIPIMQLLLDYGADINAKDHHGDTALSRAIVNRKLQSVQFLIEHSSLINFINYHQQTPMSQSIHPNQLDIALLLINSGADLDLDIHHRVLHDAICRGAPIHVIECLLEHGASVTTVYNNKTALQRAISFRYCSTDWKLHVAKLLLIYGSDHYVEDYRGNTVLHWACRMGDVELVKYLIYYGLDVDAKNREEKTPSDIATEKGHTNIVKEIIHYHCNKYTKF